MSKVVLKKKKISDENKPNSAENSNFIEKVVSVRRVTKVVKGGRRLGFSAFVVVGDGNGRVGVSSGKGKEVQPAVAKAVKRARKKMLKVNMKNTTLPHDIEAKFGASKVFLKPAAKGTGVIAGGAVRAIMNACGIEDILTKSLGSSNSINVSYATLKALGKIRNFQMVKSARGFTGLKKVSGE